jgi:hypothetical protein
VLAGVGALLTVELAAPCPQGGPIAFGDCSRVRPFAVAVAGLAGVLYAIGLSAVHWWTTGLVRRGAADTGAARDWYLLAAGLGLVIAPLLAFTLVSMLR